MAESIKARPFTKKERILSSASATKEDDFNAILHPPAAEPEEGEQSISNVLDMLFSPPSLDDDIIEPPEREDDSLMPPFLAPPTRAVEQEDDEVFSPPVADPNPNAETPRIDSFSVDAQDLDAELENDLNASLAEDEATATHDENWENEFDAEIKATVSEKKNNKSGLRAIASGSGTTDDDEMAYQKHQEIVKMDAEHARKIMNLLATMGPVFKRVVGNSDSDDSARVVSELLIKAESLKQKLYSVFNAKHEQQIPKWLKAQLSRYAVSMTTEHHSMPLDDMVHMSKQLSEFMPDLRYEYSTSVDDKMQIKLSLIKALSKIEVDINTFATNLIGVDEVDLAKNIENHRAEIIDDVSSFIINKVSSAMDQLKEPKSTSRTRTMMAQSLINQAAEFYSAALSYEISHFWERRTNHKDKGRRKDFMEQFSDRNPEGAPIAAASSRAEDSFDALTGAVEKEFDKQFDRLINFTYSKVSESSELKNSSEIN